MFVGDQRLFGSFLAFFAGGDLGDVTIVVTFPGKEKLEDDEGECARFNEEARSEGGVGWGQLAIECSNRC